MRRDAQALAAALQDLDAQQLRRVRRSVQGFAGAADILLPAVDGTTLVNFCSNDYLGLARHPRLVAALQAAAQEFGVGSGAAHLVSGHSREHQLLEEELAAYTGRERALLFSTGYMANLGVITALAGRGDLVLGDRLNHASLLDAALLSGARHARYAHADAGDAARRCGPADDAADAGGRTLLLATDGIFSMDGDIAPLAALAQLAAQRRAWLVVDDAHGLGVCGAQGRGALELAGLDARQVPVLVGTLGKAFGSFGAFAAGDADVIEYILQRARSYLFTTALPPAVAAATRAALRVAQEEGWRRDTLHALVQRFRGGAAQLGLALADSATPIQPLLIGNAAQALAASAALREAGYWVAAIRAPTVPAGSERLRITLSAAHTAAQVDGLLEALPRALARAT
jgi:8-amino-7-oxononanoate synthase